MSERFEENITQEVRCSVCSKTHKYPMTITRAKTLIGRNKVVTTKTKEYTRLFLCPTKNELFEAKIELQEGGEGEIIDTKVDGPMEDE